MYTLAVTHTLRKSEAILILLWACKVASAVSPVMAGLLWRHISPVYWMACEGDIKPLPATQHTVAQYDYIIYTLADRGCHVSKSERRVCRGLYVMYCRSGVLCAVRPSSRAVES